MGKSIVWCTCCQRQVRDLDIAVNRYCRAESHLTHEQLVNAERDYGMSPTTVCSDCYWDWLGAVRDAILECNVHAPTKEQLLAVGGR